MNQIVNSNTASTLTMSSRETAELTGKRHDNICRDVFKMLTGLKSEVSEDEVHFTQTEVNHLVKTRKLRHAHHWRKLKASSARGSKSTYCEAGNIHPCARLLGPISCRAYN